MASYELVFPENPFAKDFRQIPNETRSREYSNAFAR